MTNDGGSHDRGVIFSFDPSSSTFITLKNFDGTDGVSPSGSLVQAHDGKLYGMTGAGGDEDNNGVIFSFDPTSLIFKKLQDFYGPNGANPYGNLMQATDGMLYGMTNYGGANGLGVVFSFDPSKSIYTKLKDYDRTNGAYPSEGSA